MSDVEAADMERRIAQMAAEAALFEQAIAPPPSTTSTSIPTQSTPSTTTATKTTTASTPAAAAAAADTVASGTASATPTSAFAPTQTIASIQGVDASHVAENKADVDARSVHVSNVDYSSTPEDVQAFFQSCGTILRVTILTDKYTGHPKGYCYVEFADTASAENALILNDSLFKGRVIKVAAKRTNVPGLSARGGGRGRGAYRARGGFRGGFRGAPRGRGGFRGGFRGARGGGAPGGYGAPY